MPDRLKFSVCHSGFLVLLLALATLSPLPCRAQGFPPLSPDDLKMTSESKAAGAPAIILFREVDRDDNARTPHEDNYLRIKILTEQGRENANVEIVFDKGLEDVAGIHARTIKPDGSSVNFDGKVYEKTIEKARGLKYLAKTFTLPDVQVGSIIEYRYTDDLRENYVYSSHWILSHELFTRKAKFTLKPYLTDYNPPRLRWTWQGLPPELKPVRGPDNIIRLEMNDIPAFQEEDFMPPPNELKARVDFIYDFDFLDSRTADQFWKEVAKKRRSALESFIGKRKAMEDAVAQIVSPSDSPEVKLRKIYDRVQKIRNTSYEVHKTEQEEKRDKEKPVENVEELWKRGYGDAYQLAWLYLALVRAAGFEAYGVWVSSRSEYFFHANTMENQKLNTNVVLVKLNGKDLYFDPGIEFTPFGMLTWSEAGVTGLCLDKEGGTWVTTTLPEASESRIDHVAKLRLTDAGTLEGKLTVTYTGLEAMYQRLEARNEDDVARKKLLEEAVKNQISAVPELELTNQPDWSRSGTPLVAEYQIKIPDWASNAGKRAVVPAAVFTAVEKHIFEHANRVQPIYVDYPFEKDDDVTIELPHGWQVSSVPPPQEQPGHIVTYSLQVGRDGDALHLTRKLSWNFLFLEQRYYPALRNFFQSVRTADDQQIVLQPAAASAGD
jgi:transglutaminase-like putative cysteine protease